MFLTLTLLSLLTAVAQAAPLPTVSADALLAQKLALIDEHIAKRNFSEAVRTALTGFSLNATSCRGIDTRHIETRDENGNEVVAHTQLDQIVVLDPRQIAFKNARFLVSILAHETTHCDQNQHMYTLALNTDRELAPLKDKLPLLRTFADLDEVASIALKDTPAKAEALVKFKAISTKYGLTLTPTEMVAAAKRFMDDAQTYKRTLAELHEMEASLRAFELPGVIPPPRADQKASEEFKFQYRFLLLSTNKFLKGRQLFGATGDGLCRLWNLVPFEMTLQHERTCSESIRMAKDFLAKVPE